MAAEPVPSSDKWMNFLRDAVNLEVDESLEPGMLLSPQQTAGSAGNNTLTADDGERATSATRKRSREDCAVATEGCSKANREKMRRDRLNDRFFELSRSLEPGKAPKSDKASILCDAVRVLAQLRAEAAALRDNNSQLQEQIKELKAEKHELREEKARLKAENDKLQQSAKAVPMPVPAPAAPPPPAFNPHAAAMQAAAAAYAAQMQCHMAMGPPKPVAGPPAAMGGMPAGAPAMGAPAMGPPQHHQAQGYAIAAPAPPMAMWQWMAPASVDTSQDHMLRPPVA
eukprot:TRINITY_DN7272_c0_g1_i1.p1 TRINITY_DN7272_c0_g1~~TRINITY_DN7272_c0_g1_i1.p1  ORF type:complete len:284 (+),score=26.07 TRINITY_DN7272_c0_g1_i1:56-907(+)